MNKIEQIYIKAWNCLECFSVQDLDALALVFSLRNPHLFKRIQRSQNRSTLNYKKKSFQEFNLTIKKIPIVTNPIQVEYKRSFEELILILVSFEATFFSSFSKRSPKPLKSVEPPERTIFWYKVFRKSISDLMIESARSSWMPSDSSPIKSGLKSNSGAL